LENFRYFSYVAESLSTRVVACGLLKQLYLEVSLPFSAAANVGVAGGEISVNDAGLQLVIELRRVALR
jgi:hypothetical protein